MVDLDDTGMIGQNSMNFVSKRWGWESWIVNNDLYCGKLIFIKKGKWLSYHCHKIKTETLYVNKGSVYFSWGDEEMRTTGLLQEGEAFQVSPFSYHQIEAIEDTVIIEFSTTHSDEDSYRETTDNVRTKQKDLSI